MNSIKVFFQNVVLWIRGLIKFVRESVLTDEKLEIAQNVVSSALLIFTANFWTGAVV